MFWALLAHYQVVHSEIKQSSNLPITLNMFNCRTVRQCMNIVMDMYKVNGAACRFECIYRLLHLLYTNSSLYSYTNELARILHAENSRGVVRLFYTAVHSQNVQDYAY